MSSEKPLPQETKGAHREADVYDLLAWFEVNKKIVFAGAIVLVVIGFVIATMRHLRAQKELKASGELLALKAALNPPTNAAPVQASAFTKVAQEFGGTGAAERARFLAATALFTEGKYSEAETAFRNFSQEFGGSVWRAAAAYGVATAQEAQGKPETLASYQNVTTAYANSAVVNDAKLAVARIYEQKNQPVDALRIYNELLAPKPGALTQQARNSAAEARKEALLRAHPQLSTNAIPPAAVTPGATNAIAPTLQIPAAQWTNATQK